MEFQTIETTTNDTKDIVLNFLKSVDATALSAEVLDAYGWGSAGDPVETALEILIKKVNEW